MKISLHGIFILCFSFNCTRWRINLNAFLIWKFQTRNLDRCKSWNSCKRTFTDGRSCVCVLNSWRRKMEERREAKWSWPGWIWKSRFRLDGRGGGGSGCGEEGALKSLSPRRMNLFPHVSTRKFHARSLFLSRPTPNRSLQWHACHACCAHAPSRARFLIFSFVEFDLSIETERFSRITIRKLYWGFHELFLISLYYLFKIIEFWNNSRNRAQIIV